MGSLRYPRRHPRQASAIDLAPAFYAFQVPLPQTRRKLKGGMRPLGRGCQKGPKRVRNDPIISDSAKSVAVAAEEYQKLIFADVASAKGESVRPLKECAQS